MVRLKAIAANVKKIIDKFQFLMVRLKVFVNVIAFDSDNKFQFLMVRLKA